QRSRRARRPDARPHPGGRRAAAPDDGIRAAPARSGARGVPQALRRAQDAGTHSVHAENREDPAKLMRIIDKGSGPALVLIPRLEGRWEYMGRAIDALAQSFRVITFPLCGEPDCVAPYDPARGLDNYVAQVADTFDRLSIERAIVCGVSFGGVVAVRFAAAHPNRTAALVIATAPEPRFHLKRRHAVYARAPRLFGPIFLFEAQRRFRPELKAAIPSMRDRIRFVLEQARTFRRAPISLGRMGARARIISTLDLTADCARIAAPTLVITGEPGLDK